MHFMNMYVSNLGFRTSDQDLKKLFEQYGSVSSARVITDRTTGKSRGFAFVEMNSQPEAEAAMAALHEKEFDGRAISVTVAREKQEGGNKRY
jgi:RNA recognition motif-containing protein